ncbi:MAG: 2Fe-2S iron-sulfur cluster-binding protein [Betaproteobacteria bacterium]
MSDTTSLTLNGLLKQVNAPSNTPLLYVLRNDLDHKGTRFGCGSGNCGACTAIVDGHAVQTCDVPLWSAENKEIITAEGLSQDPIGKLLQDEFIAEQAAQCGYCINGILMSVTALLKKTSQPSHEELYETLNRHLCRCGTHVRIIRAVNNAITKLSTGVLV